MAKSKSSQASGREATGAFFTSAGILENPDLPATEAPMRVGRSPDDRQEFVFIEAGTRRENFGR